MALTKKQIKSIVQLRSLSMIEFKKMIEEGEEMDVKLQFWNLEFTMAYDKSNLKKQIAKNIAILHRLYQEIEEG